MSFSENILKRSEQKNEIIWWIKVNNFKGGSIVEKEKVHTR